MMGRYYKRKPQNNSSKWEQKKAQANEDDFSHMRLLVGAKASLIIILTFKISLIISITLSILRIWFTRNTYKIILIGFWTIPTLAIITIIILSTIGLMYNHVGNTTEKIKKTFKK